MKEEQERKAAEEVRIKAEQEIVSLPFVILDRMHLDV